MSVRISRVSTYDVRFPTSVTGAGSDAMNSDPDYSAAYVVLETDHPDGAAGHGLAFTCGRGNEVVVAAIEALSHHVAGRTLDEVRQDPAGLWRSLVGDSHLRWLGPEKGAVHMAVAAIVNAVWDLWAKVEGKPLWRTLADMPSEQLVACIDFRHIEDALSPEDALEILRRNESTRDQRAAEMLRLGFPAYTTSAGWIGYADERLPELAGQGLELGFTAFKLKVGGDPEVDLRRARLLRHAIGPENRLMLDANQVWGVSEAVAAVAELAEVDPWWIEEPTSPDDVFGHQRIRQAVAPVLVATGEHVHNRIMWKQFFQAGATDVCQVDACRLGGVNEVLAVLLMAAKFGVPVCPHGGGVGLCEYVQHLAIFDYIAVGASLDGRICEYVAHLHEHFVDPCRLARGRYLAPVRPGFSIEMRPDSVAEYAYPDGPVWQRVLAAPSTGGAKADLRKRRELSETQTH